VTLQPLFARPSKILSLVLSLVIFLSGCAYTLKTILPEHIKKIAIPTFKNKTFHYGLEETLTDVAIREFIVDGRLRVGRKETADALLSGEITHYNREPLSYDNENIVEEYKIRILVDVAFRDLTTGEVLWKEKEMEGEATYSVRIEPIETEQEGLERAIEELARKIVSRAIEGW
jgi:outer membrane lipopolysaccharide assembly protein LptE/RlpB